MDINATLFVEMIIFLTFIMLTVKFIWPPITAALAARAKTIADGIKNAELAKKEREETAEKSAHMLDVAKEQARLVIEQAEYQSGKIIENATTQATAKKKKIIAEAQTELMQERNKVQKALIKEVGNLALATSEKILQKNIDKASNEKLLTAIISGN